jgi:hypothetical protein
MKSSNVVSLCDRVLLFTARAAGVALVLVAFAATARADEPVTPEIDPGFISSGMALVIGGALLLTGRFRRK